MRSKSTKSSWILSMLSVVLCISMLIGSTYAWFTDSKSVGCSVIQSGTLEVVLEYWDGDSWENAEGAKLDFVKATGGKDQAVYWEPGCTYELPKIRVRNEGNLTAYFVLRLAGVTGDEKLLDAITLQTKVTNIPESSLTGSQAGAFSSLNNATFEPYYGTPDGNVLMDWILAPKGEVTPNSGHTDTSAEFIISGHMDELAGNEYQGLSISGVSIQVIATQAVYEYDSYGRDYDEKAELPEVWDGTVDTVALEANTDDAAKTVTIENGNQLAALALAVDGGDTYSGYTVYLDNDIDLGYGEFEAIGDISNPFSGSIDGQGHTISNLKITKKTTADKRSENRQALISSYKPIGESYIQNITLENIDVSGGRSVGGLLGVVQGADLNTNTLTISNINIIGDIKMDCYYSAGALLATGETIKEISNITIDVSKDSYISNLENGNTCTAMCIGSVGGWVKADVVDNIVSNLNVSGKDGGIGGLFGELMGQSSVAKLSNLNYTGKVTVVEIAGSDGEGCTYSIQGNKVSFTKYFNGLLVGTPRFSVVADEATCKSTGTMELRMLDGTVLTTNSMGTWYEDWAVDLFGASYDTAASGYAKKSFSLNYAK